MAQYSISSLALFLEPKCEFQFKKSQYSGLSLFPLLILINCILNFTFITLCYIVITLWLFYKNKDKWKYMIAIIIYCGQIVQFQQFYLYPLFIISMVNFVLIPHWPFQLIGLLVIGLILKKTYIIICLAILLRAAEILKRQLFITLFQIDLQKKEQQQFLRILPHHILFMNENQQIIYNNKQISFNNEDQKNINNIIRKRQFDYQINILQENHYIQYQIKKYNNKYLIIQCNFEDNDDNYFKEQDELIQKLYQQLCNDYIKWLNLRAFKTIKESDLQILGYCLYKCQLLNHFSQSLITEYQYEINDFYIKTTLCNLIEAMTNDLFKHFEKINLQFENGIPDIVKGDKNLLIYLIKTLLLQSLLSDLKNGILFIKCQMGSVNQEKSGYDLEFTIQLSSSSNMITLFSYLFNQQNQNINQNQDYNLYALKQCQLRMNKYGKCFNVNSDGDYIYIQFSFLCQLSTSNIDIVPVFTDISFCKVVIDECNFFWKKKIEIIPRKIIFDQEIQNSPLSEISIKNQIQEVIINYPEIRDDLVILLQNTLENAFKQNLLDKVHFDWLEQEIKCAKSEYADSLTSTPPQYTTPQQKKKILAKKEKIHKVIFPKICESIQSSYNSLPQLSLFQEIITQNRNKINFHKWTHKIITINKPPIIVNEILCLLPNSKLQRDIITNFGNFNYGNYQIKDPIIVYDISNVIQKYKEYLQQGKLFYFIMLFVSKPSEIADFFEIVKRNEQDFPQKFEKYQQSFLIGIIQSQLQLSIYAYLKFIIPFHQWTVDITQVKANIVKTRELK